MNRSTFIRAACIVASAGFLTACEVGPDYVSPTTNTPDTWATSLDGGVTASTPVDFSRWWTAFSDETLNSLIDRAIGANHDLALARARVREARALRAVTGADLYPTVDGAGGYTHQLRSENVDSGNVIDNTFVGANDRNTGPTDLYSLGFDASWEIDVFGGVKRSIEAADADVALAEENHRDVLVSLLAEVARNYVEMRSLQSRIAIARSNVVSQEDTLGLAQSRVDAGLTSELDVAQAKLNVERTRSQIPSLEAAAKQAQHRLSVLLGRQPGVLAAELDTSAPVPTPPPQIAVGLPSELLRRRPDIRRVEREIAGATARIGVATADLFPRFMLTGGAAFQASPLGSLFDTDSFAYSIGPSVRWNIFDAGRIRSNIKVQNARQEQALLKYDQAVLVALEDVENALVSYTRELVRRGSLKLATDAAQLAVDLVSERYAKGLTDFQNVLDSQRNLLVLQDELAQSDRNVTSSVVALYKSLGGGWEQVVPETTVTAKEPRP